MLALLCAIGIAGGMLTTVSGVGGGLVVWSATSLVLPPADALAASAVALLAGNGHRLWLYRASVDRGLGIPMGLGLVAGAFGGAQLIALAPGAVLRGVLAATCLAALGHAWFGFRLRGSRAGMAAAGVIAGGLGAAGGAGVLFAPLLQAAGLTGDRYIATVALVSILYNAARVLGYATAGMYSASLVPVIFVLAAALVAGNLVGDRLRGSLPHRVTQAIEVWAPVLALGLAIW